VKRDLERCAGPGRRHAARARQPRGARTRARAVRSAPPPGLDASGRGGPCEPPVHAGSCSRSQLGLGPLGADPVEPAAGVLARALASSTRARRRRAHARDRRERHRARAAAGGRFTMGLLGQPIRRNTTRRARYEEKPPHEVVSPVPDRQARVTQGQLDAARGRRQPERCGRAAAGDGRSKLGLSLCHRSRACSGGVRGAVAQSGLGCRPRRMGSTRAAPGRRAHGGPATPRPRSRAA
jgi:hypothetical protein